MPYLKIFATFVFLVVSNALLGQSWDFTAPDYKAIEKAVADEQGDFYYPNLNARFNDADSSLSLEELRHIYYGYIYESAYSPYSHSKYRSTIRELLGKDSLTQADYKTLNSYCDSSLADFPFDLDAMSYKIWALKNLSDSLAYEQILWKHNSIVDVLISSGDGISPERAFYVINTSHEYYLLGVFGFKFGNQQSLIGECDLLDLAENEFEIDGLYFNVSACLNHLNTMFDD
tara:strand:+ start:211 stop:903 length:693 start_codon:yes stop_codon:yes gene_type:complete